MRSLLSLWLRARKRSPPEAVFVGTRLGRVVVVNTADDGADGERISTISMRVEIFYFSVDLTLVVDLQVSRP